MDLANIQAYPQIPRSAAQQHSPPPLPKGADRRSADGWGISIFYLPVSNSFTA
jgi:hypothetical protein